MGMQDRDYYREWWANKEGHVEKSKLRVSAGAVDDDGGEYLRPQKMPTANPNPSEWHPVLTILATVTLCLAVYALLRLAS